MGDYARDYSGKPTVNPLSVRERIRHRRRHVAQILAGAFEAER